MWFLTCSKWKGRGTVFTCKYLGHQYLENVSLKTCMCVHILFNMLHLTCTCHLQHPLPSLTGRAPLPALPACTISRWYQCWWFHWPAGPPCLLACLYIQSLDGISVDDFIDHQHTWPCAFLALVVNLIARLWPFPTPCTCIGHSSYTMP